MAFVRIVISVTYLLYVVCGVVSSLSEKSRKKCSLTHPKATTIRAVCSFWSHFSIDYRLLKSGRECVLFWPLFLVPFDFVESWVPPPIDYSDISRHQSSSWFLYFLHVPADSKPAQHDVHREKKCSLTHPIK
jgi:hypothetical protein